jgi:DNA-binding NarL/FixJ family response regulator
MPEFCPKIIEMPIKTIIYEDNPSLRGALAGLISRTEGFELCGAFESCDHVVADVGALKPDVVLMDIDLVGNLNGIEGVALLKNAYPDIEALMLTVFDDDERVMNAILAGANGYLLKKTPPDKILEAIRDTVAGGAPMSPSVARQVLTIFSTTQKHPHQSELDTLTDREMAVLRTLSKGFSYKMVAAELQISIETVRSHVKRIYEKLHVHSVSEAIAKAFLKK